MTNTEQRGGSGFEPARREASPDDRPSPAPRADTHVAAYEEDWYRSLRALAERHSALEDERPDERPDEQPTEEQTKEASAGPVSPLTGPSSAPEMKVQSVQRSGAADTQIDWLELLRIPPEERADAIQTIEMTSPGELSLHALEALHSTEHDERLLAAEVVGWGKGQACIEAAIHALLDPWAAVRIAAAASLARLADPSAAQALGKALGDPDAGVRLAVVQALGVIDDESVLGFLVSALNDPDPGVREEASEVLTEWSSPAVAKRLAGVLAVPALRGHASDLLKRIGPTCTELLIDVLLQHHPGVRQTVGELLMKIAGFDELQARLDSVEPDRRFRALEAIGAIGGDRALEALVATMSDPDERTRIRSAELLAEIGGPPAAQALQVALRDPDPAVRAVAEVCLSRMPGWTLASGM